MELAASYLFTLATISITFAGFAALTIILRQLAGGKLTDFDLLFVSNVLRGGFIVAGCALLPPLLAMLGFSESNIWRFSSFITAAAQAIFLVTGLARRRAVAGLPISKWSLVNYAAQWAATAYLALVATQFVAPTAGMFIAGLTAFVLLGFVAYLMAFKTFLQIEDKKKKPR